MSNPTPSGQTVREILERAVARGVDAANYLGYDVKEFNATFGAGADEAEAAINAHIVIVLEQNAPNLDGINPNNKDFYEGFALARQEYLDAIAKYKQEPKS